MEEEEDDQRKNCHSNRGGKGDGMAWRRGLKRFWQAWQSSQVDCDTGEREALQMQANELETRLSRIKTWFSKIIKSRFSA